MKTFDLSLRRGGWLILALISGFAVGCDNTVDPFIESDRYFTIFGYLDTATDTQYVRVVPFRTEIGGTAGDTLDVRVTATDLENDVVYEWRDSVITYSDGSVGHVFYAPFRPIPQHTYRFSVEKPDGSASWAETVVPPAEEVEVTPPAAFADPPLTQTVTWRDIEVEPFRVEVWYRFSEYPPNEPFTDLVVTYDEIGGQVNETDWRVQVKLTEDLEEIKPMLRPGSPLMGVGMRLTMSDDAWRPPGGVFNREVLVQPGTFSNVEHGFGYFGSVNQYTVEWVLDPATVEKLGVASPGKH